MIERVNILGVGVSAVDMNSAIDAIEEWIAIREPHYVCLRDVHGLMLCQSNERLRAIHNAAGLVTPDGMPLVWCLKLAGRKAVERVYGPDLMLAVFAHPKTRHHRHFLYGTTEETLQRLRSNLERRFPQAKIVGSHAPPFRPLSEDEDRDVIRLIDESRADIVWVGLSTPKQEIWMAEHTEHLAAPVLIGVGAAFDFHAGRVRQAPRAIQRSGFEWLFRLLMEPRRLWKRYLVNNPKFLLLILLQLLGLRRQSAMDRRPGKTCD